MFVGDRRTKWMTLGSMCVALFMVFLDSTVVYLALPSIQSSLQTDTSGLQWVVDMYSLWFASLMLTGGAFGDRWGRKRTFLTGLTVFGISSMLCGAAPSMEVLIAGRALQGVGAALLLPNTTAVITSAFSDPSERAQAFGIWSAVSGIAYIVGPFLGGALVALWGWQSIFFLNVPVGLAAFLLASRVVRESRDPNPGPLDLAGQILWIVGIGTLTYVLIEGDHMGWTSLSSLVLFGLAVGGLIAFGWVERRGTHPMLPLRFFSSATFSASIFVSLLLGFGIFSLFFTLSLYLQQVQGYSAMEAGIRILPAMVAMVMVAPVAGRMAGRFGSKIPMTVGLVLFGTGLLMLMFIDIHTPYTQWWWFLILIGTGIGSTMSPMVAAVMGSVPPTRAGMASATLSTGREAGGLIGIALIGSLVTDRFLDSLQRSLDSLGLPDSVKEQMVHRLLKGGLQHAGEMSLPPGVDAETARNVVGQAFMEGMHTGLLVIAVLCGIGSFAAWMFVGRTETVDQNSVGEHRFVSEGTQGHSEKGTGRM